MKHKAEKLLGYETYFDLSPLTGQPLTIEDQPELFSKLMQIQKKLTSDLDESLARHNKKIDQFDLDISMTTSAPPSPPPGEEVEIVVEKAASAESVPLTPILVASIQQEPQPPA